KIFISLICNILISLSPGNLIFTQNITNTLGTSGLFTIKDASNNYLTLNQSTGNLSLTRSLTIPNTTNSTTGIIFKGADRFIHNYGTANTFIGINSGNFTMTGVQNTVLGMSCFRFNTSGYNNIAVGYGSLSGNTTGSNNTALGTFSLSVNSTGNYNTALGTNSLRYNSTGSQNTAVGWESLVFNNTGDQNTAVGYSSLNYNTTGFQNTALGMYSLFVNTSGNYNTALGYGPLFSNTSGERNTSVGYFSLYSNTIGLQNTCLGMYSLFSNTSGNENTAVGYNSLYSSTGFQNTALGHHSLYSNTGNYNTAVGYNSGSTITTGNNLTCIGIDAAPSSGSTNDQITLGNIYVTSLRCNVTTITSLSDARDKKNITDLSLGLDFIVKLKPRQFNWDKREWYDDNTSDGSKMESNYTSGFIAQEFDEVQNSENAEWMKLVLKDNPEKWEATPGNLLPVMVKAIQELKAENDELKSEIESLKNLKDKITQIEQVLMEMNTKNNDGKEIKSVEK
ncbi:MAG TPA: tail fiber domain-containing protein, partial [Ignavibacteria bacterium]|nr:tail fiber domain-containing protein [Ignavibacteria bacterium]